MRRWQALLWGIAVLNMTLWVLTGVAVVSAGTPQARAALPELLLSTLYVWGCAFRCALPVYDIPRIVLVDKAASNIALGRSIATVAELAFATQWAWTLQALGAATHHAFAQAVSLIILPLIAVAEVCSWYAVLTRRQAGHIFENSIWGLLAGLVSAALWAIGPLQVRPLHRLALVSATAGSGYFAFVFLIDVPMYWRRWRQDRSAASEYVSLSQGWAQVRTMRVLSLRWEDWKSEVPWMTLYFTVGVWSSLSLVYAAMAHA